MPKNHLPPQDPLDLLGIHIGRIDSALDQWMRKQGHSYASFAVLYMLGTTEGGICTQKQICDEWSLSKQTVFSICKGLIDKGLLELHQSRQDRRERLLKLTPAGLAHAMPVPLAPPSSRPSVRNVPHDCWPKWKRSAPSWKEPST